MTDTPTLRTPRLLLRLAEYSDWKDMLDLESDPEVNRLTDVRFGPQKETPSRQTLKIAIKNWLRNGQPIVGHRWVVACNKTNKYFGNITIEKSSLLQNYCIGFRLLRQEWKKGYTSEALKPVIDFAFNEMNLTSLYAIVNTENHVSLALLKKAGFTQSGTLGSNTMQTSPLNTPSGMTTQNFTSVTQNKNNENYNYFILQLNKATH